jgi:hypothetical protein
MCLTTFDLPSTEIIFFRIGFSVAERFLTEAKSLNNMALV